MNLLGKKVTGQNSIFKKSQKSLIFYLLVKMVYFIDTTVSEIIFKVSIVDFVAKNSILTQKSSF